MFFCPQELASRPPTRVSAIRRFFFCGPATPSPLTPSCFGPSPVEPLFLAASDVNDDDDAPSSAPGVGVTCLEVRFLGTVDDWGGKPICDVRGVAAGVKVAGAEAEVDTVNGTE